MSSEAFVTLAMDDDNARNALVLAQSIRQFGTERNLVILVSNGLSDSIRFIFDFFFSIDLERIIHLGKVYMKYSMKLLIFIDWNR